MRNACLLVSLVSLAFSVAGETGFFMVNEDNELFFTGPSEDMTVDGLIKYVDSWTKNGCITHYFMCACGQRTNYDSKVWEPIWKGIDEPNASGRTNNPWCVNAKLLHDRGIDPYEIWISRCRENGVSPWISMRMNDVHYVTVENYFRNESFWRHHPELRRFPMKAVSGGGRWSDFALDYSHEAVRKHALDMVRELLERYDADGIELDFMRNPETFAPGRETEGARLLTEFLGTCRQLATAVSARRGHPVSLAVRLPCVLKIAHAYGFRPETWARNGLVDMFILSNRFAVRDCNFNFMEWKRALTSAGVRVKIVVGTDMQTGCPPDPRHRPDGTLDALRGWCSLYENQADGVYLFNASYLRPELKYEIKTGGLSPERLRAGARRYVVSWHDCGPEGGRRGAQLPRSLNKPIRLDVRVVRFAEDRDALLTLVFQGDRPLPERLDVRLNDYNPAVVSPRETHSLCWTFSAASLKDGVNEIVVIPKDKINSQVVHAEIAIGEKGSRTCGR